MECKDCGSFFPISPSSLDFSSSCSSRHGSCEACASVNAIKSEIEETLVRLNTLIVSLQNAKMKMNDCHSSIIQKLPAEITSTIFEIFTSNCIDMSGTSDLPQSLVLPVPLRLSQVCKTWGQIAKSTSRIWCNLSIDLELVYDTLELEFIREWIYRSGNFPLNVYFYIKEKFFNRSPDTFSIIDVLATASARWKNLSLRMPYASLCHLFRRAGKLPFLDALAMYDTSPYIFDEDVVPSDPLWEQDKPSPRSLVVSCIHTQVVNLEWNRVTSLTAQGITTYQCVLLIRFARSLVTCKFENIQIDSENNPFNWNNPPLVTHPNITHISYSSDICSDLFNSVTLPSLKSLIYEDLQGIDDWVSSLGEFLIRSTISLEKLEMRNISLHFYETLRTVFRAIPTLQHLRLTSDVVYEHDDVTPTPFFQHLAEAFTVNAENIEDVILPHLTTLEL